MADEKLKREFERFDIDQDGRISVSEIVKLMKLLGNRINEEDAKEMLAKLDDNEDGTIDEKEFVAFMKNHANENEIRTAFELFDKDRSGVISAAELCHVLTEFNHHLTDEEVDEMMRVADTDGDGKINFQEFSALMQKIGQSGGGGTISQVHRSTGVSECWSAVNHIAIVVSDVGRSCAFYGGTLGMQQIMRPDFDRHGAWFTLGNVDLHLIKGRPCVHPDDDLIVGHIALNVGGEADMKRLMKRLDTLNVAYRENISVPNPDSDLGRVKQAFVRDPDGYYIEFCSCQGLEQYLQQQMAVNSSLWDVPRVSVAISARNLVRDWAGLAKSGVSVDKEKLDNLLARQKIYGDITQSASPLQLEEMLKMFNNDIPAVIASLKDITKKCGGQVYLPPAFFERDQSFVQPPGFKISSSGQTMAPPVRKNSSLGGKAL